MGSGPTSACSSSTPTACEKMARRARKASPSPVAEPEEPIEEEAASASDDGEQDGSDDSGDNETSSDEEEPVYVEPNLATRTRRANAGARMAALIEDEAAAGIEADEMFKEEENDEEFAQKGAHVLGSEIRDTNLSLTRPMLLQRKRTSLIRISGRPTKAKVTRKTTKRQASASYSGRPRRLKRCAFQASRVK